MALNGVVLGNSGSGKASSVGSGGSALKGVSFGVTASPKAPVVKTPTEIVPKVPDVKTLAAGTKPADTSGMFSKTSDFVNSFKSPMVSSKTQTSTPSMLAPSATNEDTGLLSKPVGDTLSQDRGNNKTENPIGKIIDTVKNFIHGDSKDNYAVNSAVQKNIVDTQLVDIGKKMGIDKQFPLDETKDKTTAQYNQNKEISDYVRTNWDTVKSNLSDPSALPDHPEMLGPKYSEVQKNLSTFTKQLGVRDTPTNKEFIGYLTMAPVAAEFGVAGAVSFAGAMAFSYVEHKLLGDSIAGKIADQFGIKNNSIRDVMDLVEMFGVGAGLHKIYTQTPDIAQSWTKDIVTKYMPGQKIAFEPEQVFDILSGKKSITTEEQQSIFNALGLDSKQMLEARRNGVSVDVSPEKILTLVDKPYWSKIKQFFHVTQGTEPVDIGTEKLGETKVGAENRPHRLLGEGQTKINEGGEILHNEVKQAVETHGTDATHQALREKFGVDSGTATRLMNDVQTRDALKNPAEVSQQVLDTVAKPKALSGKPAKGQILTPYDTPEVIAMRNKIGEINHTDNIKTPEREALRKEIIDKVYGDGAKNKNKRLDIVTGGPGSRKSSMIAEPLAKEHGSLIADSDHIKKHLPEFGPKGEGAGQVHIESSKMNAEILNKALKNGDNLVYPTVGEKLDRLHKIIDKFHAEGYEIHLHNANLPLEKSVPGTIERWKKGEQGFVDPDYIHNTVGLQPAHNYDILKTNDKLTSTTKYSTDVKRGERPEVIDRRERNRQLAASKQGLDTGGGDGTSERVHGHVSGGIKEPVKPATVTLHAGIDPGVDKFLKEDVIPTTGRALVGFRNVLDGIAHTLVPTKGVKLSDLDSIMKMKGARDKQEYIFSKTHEIIEREFNEMSQKDQIDFIDRMKRGELQENSGLQAVADNLRKIDTAMWEQAKAYRPSLAWKENHFRVLWKTIPGSPESKGFKGIFRKPLQGTKGFTKQATLTDMSEGIAKGGIPISYNPIKLFSTAYADMNKFITAQEMIGTLKDQGQMKFVRPGGQVPANFVRINDSISKVYMPIETTAKDAEGDNKTVVVQKGEWYIEENVGRIMNNFLSTDHIRASDLGRGLLAIKNAFTAVELSLSPFHAVFESLEAMGSNIGLGVQKLARGNVGGLKDIAGSPVSPFTTAKLGGDAIRYLTEEGFLDTPAGKDFAKKFPDAMTLLDDLFIGGGKMKLDQGYQISTEETFKQNIKTGNYIGATLRALPSLSKTITKPLFDIYIPRLKIGTFLKEYSNDLVENSGKLAEGETTRATLARERWNFVEDRFGEMNFDNLFWNRTLKTSMQLLFRSVTWKMGNIRATGGAFWNQGKEFYSAAKERRAPRLNPKMAWLIGMSVVTVVIGTLMQKMMSGKNPSSLKDIIYPQVDDQGNRISTPTYWKDAFHLAHDPAGYVTSSMSGNIGRFIDVWQNHDFYGTEISDPNDPFYKRAMDNMIHLIPVPFSVSSTLSLRNSGAPTSKQALSFFGFTKAPAYINQTQLQNKIFDLLDKRQGQGTKTKEDAAAQQQKSDIKKAYQNGDPDKANKLLDQAIKDGVIKEKGVTTFMKNADLPGDIKAFTALPASYQTSLIKGMSADDLYKYAWYAKPEVKNNFSTLSDNAKNFVDQVKSGDLKQPKFKAGVMQGDGAKPTFTPGQKTSSTGLISRIGAYAQAIGTDPVTAFHDIFHGQTIREVTNGTVIVDRMSLKDSTKIKKGMGGDSTMELDHWIPLSLGGTNETSNLRLIPLSKAGVADKLENELARKLKDGTITKKEAQAQIIKFKESQ